MALLNQGISSSSSFKKGGIGYFNTLISGMKIERETFIAHYKDLQENISPRRGRFFEQDRNKGNKRHKAIINSIGTQALRVGVAGLLNGTMSPSRPWFALETFNTDIMEDAATRDWLFKVEIILRTILNESNFYNMAPVFLKELLLFGTSFMTHVNDFEDVARFYAHTAGSYMLAQNDRLEVDTMAREFEWPVIQIIKQFGLENTSRSIKEAYDKGNYNAWYPIVHFVEPNDDFTANHPLTATKQFTSVYFEPGNDGRESDKFLSKSGFDQFPGYAARWDVTEGDVYGVDCPGMTALGDVKQLQIEEKEKAKGIAKMVSPPLQGPPSVKNTPVSGLPGGLTVYEGDDQKQKLQPIYQVDPRLQELRLDMTAVERRIENAFFNDLFLAISNMEGIQPRNQLDLSQRNEERLIQLGPVLERIHGEFLEHMIDRLFIQSLNANILPPPPPAIQGSALRIRFISTLAMAQRAVVVQDIERLTQFIGVVAQSGKPEVLDKYDADQAVDEYGRAIGIPPRVVKSDDVVAEIRQQRAEQQAQQQQMERAAATVEMAKTGSEIDASADSPLDRIGEELGSEGAEGG
jgi:hypothetical protein